MLLLPVDVLPAVLLLPVLLLALPFDDDVDVLRLDVLPELPDTALLVLDEELRVT